MSVHAILSLIEISGFQTVERCAPPLRPCDDLHLHSGQLLPMANNTSPSRRGLVFRDALACLAGGGHRHRLSASLPREIQTLRNSYLHDHGYRTVFTAYHRSKPLCFPFIITMLVTSACRSFLIFQMSKLNFL